MKLSEIHERLKKLEDRVETLEAMLDVGGKEDMTWVEIKADHALKEDWDAGDLLGQEDEEHA